MSNINPKHRAHIIAADAAAFAHRKNSLCDFTLTAGDIIIGRRHELENDYRYRQLLTVTAFTHNGKIWAYQRTDKGGEAGLHNQVAVAVGGHWDLADLVHNNSEIDVEASLKRASEREIEEEINLSSEVVRSHTLSSVIAADDTGVDAKHAAIVTIVELDGEGIESAEDELDGMGFFTPDELLNGDHPLETWARLICEILRDAPKTA